MHILCVHGFGVQKDDRGLFTSIASAFSQDTFYMFDMNDVDHMTGNLLTPPLEEQATRLENYIRLSDITPDIIIAHSMGCVVSCLVKGIKPHAMIFLTPPFAVDLEKTLSSFKEREGSVIDPQGISILNRRDGSKTTVPASFWESKVRNEPMKLYEGIPKQIKTYILNASEDEVLKETHSIPSLPPHILIKTLPGDHNFTGESRIGMIKQIRLILLDHNPHAPRQNASAS